MEECSFRWGRIVREGSYRLTMSNLLTKCRPHINSKSSLIAQRRNPFRKSPFEMLYEDASQRRVGGALVIV